MAGNTFNKYAYMSNLGEFSKIADPGASGTFNLEGKSLTYATVTADGEYNLPEGTDVPVGTVLFVVNGGTSTPEVHQTAGAIVTMSTDEVAVMFLAQAEATNGWCGTIMKATGIT